MEVKLNFTYHFEFKTNKNILNFFETENAVLLYTNNNFVDWMFCFFW